MFASDISQLREIYDWYGEQDSYDVFYKWKHADRLSERDNQKRVQRNISKAASLTKKLVSNGSTEVFSLLEDRDQNLAFFNFAWIRRFGRFVSKGFIEKEDEFYSLLEDIYTSNPECCLNVAGCVIDERSGEKQFSKEFRERCFLFVEKIINDFSDTDVVITATAHGIKFIWKDDERSKQDAYEHLYDLAISNSKKHSTEVIRWIRFILDYSKSQDDKQTKSLVEALQNCLVNMTDKEIIKHLFPNVVQTTELIDNNSEKIDKFEDVLLSALDIGDGDDLFFVFKAHVALCLQDNRSQEFRETMYGRLNTLYSKIVEHNTVQAGRVLNRMGEQVGIKCRDEKNVYLFSFLLGFLEELYKADASSLKYAETRKHGHGRPTQHSEYIKIVDDFVSSKR